MSEFLPIDTIHELTRDGVEVGLATDVSRSLLMAGISRQYVARIDTAPSPADQLQLDLLDLNEARLAGGEVPLERWLTNAVMRIQRPDVQQKFQKALEAVAAQKTRETSPARPTGGVERVVHSDDLLPFDFVGGAARVGASIARVTVTRHEHGAPVDTPGTGQPARSSGTGWLLSADHLITNHHVIAARSASEAAPAADDLAKQAATMLVEFDIDGADAVGTPAAAGALVASDAQLDYAVIRLTDPPPRQPLVLSDGDAVTAAIGAQSPVNIIQHPGGGPKEVGIRNNLIASGDDVDVRYFTDTFFGSSGSPVCTDDWRVVALHKAWDRVTDGIEFQGKLTAWVNRGTRIDVIAEHLRVNSPEVWAKVAP